MLTTAEVLRNATVHVHVASIITTCVQPNHKVGVSEVLQLGGQTFHGWRNGQAHLNACLKVDFIRVVGRNNFIGRREHPTLTQHTDP